MVKFLRDEMVRPIETSWFGFYRPGSDTSIEKLTQSEIYRKDKLGLRRMMEDGKLIFLQLNTKHIELPYEWFVREIIPHLKDEIGDNVIA